MVLASGVSASHPNLSLRALTNLLACNYINRVRNSKNYADEQACSSLDYEASKLKYRGGGGRIF